MPLTCTAHARCLTACLSGEIDHHAAKGIMQALSQQIDRTLPTALILDCAGISFMDSSGIAILLRAKMRMDAVSGTIEVRALPAQAEKVLRAAGLHRMIKLS